MANTAIVARRRDDGSLDLHHSAHGAARLFLRELLVALDGDAEPLLGATGEDLRVEAVVPDSLAPAVRAAVHADEPLVAAEPSARVDSRRALAAHTNYLLYDAVYLVDAVRDPSEAVEPYLPLWCYLDLVRAFRGSVACSVSEPDGGALTLDERRVTARVLAGEDGLRRLLGAVHRPVLREQYRVLSERATAADPPALSTLSPTVRTGGYTCELALRSETPAYPNPVGHGLYVPLSNVDGGEYEDLLTLVDQTRVDTNVAVGTDQIAAVADEPLPRDPFELTSADVLGRFLDRLGERASDAGASVSLDADAAAEFSPDVEARVSTPVERREAADA